MSSEQGTCEPSAARYTEIPFERAEELWGLGVRVQYESLVYGWRDVIPKDEICIRFWQEARPSPFKYRVQTE